MLSFKLIGLWIFIIYLIYFIIVFKNKGLLKHIVEGTFLIYICSVINLTLFPIPFSKGTIEIEKQVSTLEHNFQLFYFLNNPLAFTVIGNTLLLMPMGFYILLFYKKIQAGFYLMSVFLLSVVIELTQLFISARVGYVYRTFDMDDLLLNTTGAFIGYFIVKVFYIKSNQALNVNLSRLAK
ncbi:VanZ family protein [Sutcliffiella horikoshii]|uniref:VanZ family protein n=1 Tax=Sutcliffiella horikoshii TaxID=79883 RepID=UPI003CF9FB86